MYFTYTHTHTHSHTLSLSLLTHTYTPIPLHLPTHTHTHTQTLTHLNLLQVEHAAREEKDCLEKFHRKWEQLDPMADNEKSKALEAQKVSIYFFVYVGYI